MIALNTSDAGRPLARQADRGTPGGGALARYTLRRSGSRPLAFRGRHLGFATGYRAGAPIWHELNLYEADDGRYVSDIRVFASGARALDQHYVTVADCLEDAIDVFETYDVRFDVPVDFDPADASLAPSELVVHSAALTCRIAESVAQYRALLAAFLYQIGHG
jgi:hypothetical protein